MGVLNRRGFSSAALQRVDSARPNAIVRLLPPSSYYMADPILHDGGGRCERCIDVHSCSRAAGFCLVYLARTLDHETEGIVFSFAFRNSYAWTHVMMTYTAPFVIPQLYNTYLPVAARTRSIHHANIHRPEHRNSIHLGGAQRK